MDQSSQQKFESANELFVTLLEDVLQIIQDAFGKDIALALKEKYIICPCDKCVEKTDIDDQELEQMKKAIDFLYEIIKRNNGL
jgi:hypothetical protein